MKLRFFGRLRDTLGGEREVELPAGIDDSEQLRGWLGAAHPELLDNKVRLAVDDLLCAGPMPLSAAREVAFLPPVSGG